MSTERKSSTVLEDQEEKETSAPRVESHKDKGSWSTSHQRKGMRPVEQGRMGHPEEEKGQESAEGKANIQTHRQTDTHSSGILEVHRTSASLVSQSKTTKKSTPWEYRKGETRKRGQVRRSHSHCVGSRWAASHRVSLSFLVPNTSSLLHLLRAWWSHQGHWALPFGFSLGSAIHLSLAQGTPLLTGRALRAWKLILL